MTSTDTAALLARRAPSVAGRVALVRAGDNPVAQATAAAGAGARAVLLADPRDRPLPMMPAGRVAAPVVGLTGDGREGRPGGEGGREGDVRPREGGARRSGRAGARAVLLARPPFDGPLKPDVLAEGAALTPEGLVAGTAVAAARVAVRAARLAPAAAGRDAGRDRSGARARRDRGGAAPGRPRRSRSARSS